MHVAKGGLIFLALIRSVTQSPCQIIKHTNLLSLRTDHSLPKNRLIYHLVLVVDLWKVKQYEVCDQMWERLAVPTPYVGDDILHKTTHLILSYYHGILFLLIR